MDHVEIRGRRSRAYEAAPPRPVRGGVAPGPLKVYCVEPRDFRELVQRLTGAGTAGPAPAMAMGLLQRATHTPAAASQNHGRVEPPAAAAASPELLDYASWFSAPLLSPAYAPAGFDAHHASGALL